MALTLDEKYKIIRSEALKQTGTDPLKIALNLMKLEAISMHGPEHHFLDGAAFLVAIRNAGGLDDIDTSLDELAARTIRMPGAMCGYWGVCGSVTSLGSCFSILHGVGPLSDCEYYAEDMEYTSRVIQKMSKIGGPRCCKRNAYISLSTAIEFLSEKYHLQLDSSSVVCHYSVINKQCIQSRCPFFKN
ncbi:MAG: DUF5714 domain-containing protein [Bacilli bacterium]